MNLNKYLDPKSKSNENLRTLSCRVPSDLYLLSKMKARKDGLALTQLIRGLLEYYLETENDSPKKE